MHMLYILCWRLLRHLQKRLLIQACIYCLWLYVQDFPAYFLTVIKTRLDECPEITVYIFLKIPFKSPRAKINEQTGFICKWNSGSFFYSISLLPFNLTGCESRSLVLTSLSLLSADSTICNERVYF